MLETFKKSMTVCAAVAAFGGTGVVTLRGVDSILASRVEAVLTSKAAPEESSSASVVGSVLNGARRVANVLIK